MSPILATVAFVLFVSGLFWLDRDSKTHYSPAVWLPVIWFSLACSRSVTQWLDIRQAVVSADQVMDGSPIDRLAYMIMLASGVVVLAFRRERIGKFLRANSAIVFFFFYCLVSLLWSDFPDIAFKRWIKALGDLVMVLIVLTDAKPLVAIKRLLARIGFILIPLSILFIKYYGEIGRIYGDWTGEVQYVGVTTNKNTLGALCLFLGLGSLWRFFGALADRSLEGRTRHMMAHAALVALVLWLLLKADSMTSLACFMMGGLLLWIVHLRIAQRFPVIVHILVISMLVVSVGVLFLGASPDALKSMNRNPTLTDRTQVWAMLLSLVKNPILGTGFESFWLGPRLQKMWDRYWWHPGEAHNGYLEIYLNLGWVGITLLGLVLIRAYWMMFRGWRNHIPVASLALTYFFVALNYNFTEAAFFRMLAPAWLFLLLAMVSISAFSRRKAKSPGRNSLDKQKNLIATREAVAQASLNDGHPQTLSPARVAVFGR